MTRAAWLGLALPGLLAAQTPTTKAAASAPTVVAGQTAPLWVDLSSHPHVKCDSGCTTLDSLRVVAWMDSVKLVDSLIGIRGVVKASLSAADSVQLRTGTKRIGVTSDSLFSWFGSTAPTVGQKAMASSLPVALASDQGTLPAVAEQRGSTLHVTGTAAVNTALTITLPAAGAGLFHYITSIQWVKLYSVVGVANGAGVLITSTNLPGNPVWTTEQLASPAGTAVTVINYQPTTPLKSSVANTATTIVAPLQLQTIWRGNVSYFTAP